MTRSASTLVLAFMLLSASGLRAMAQNPDTAIGGEPKTAAAAPATTESPGAATAATPSIQSSLGKYGDPGGIRAYLDSKGIDFSFTYIGEVLGNTSGGVKRGATYEGRLDGEFDVDLEKFIGLKNAAVHASAYQIHGRGLSGNNLLDLFTASGIEAYPDTKLFEAWYEQKLLDGKIAVRAGQLSADTEFFLSQTAALFVNSSYGWPASFANDLPSGGPAYPIATPGVRIKLKPDDNWTFLAAVFNGDPAGNYIPGVNSPLAQIRDRGGVAFRLEDPPFLITEGQYAYNQDKDAKGLPGTLKFGYFHHFESFADATTGVPLKGNDGIYGIVDQTIYRVPGTDDQGASAFVRGTASPSDRNLIDLYVDGGVSYKGLIPGRPDDTAGISGGYARISPDVRAANVASGLAPVVGDYQALIEATYQFSVVPGFSLQPDFQYIFHPGAGLVSDPVDGQPLRNAAVFGLRATIVY